MVYLCTALNLLQNGEATLTVELWFDVFGLCTRRACWFEIKFMDNNFWCECAIHLLHDVHYKWIGDVCGLRHFSFWLACSLSTTNQTNRPYLLPNCVLHFSEAACRFWTTCLWRRWMFWEFEKEFGVNVWWIQHSEFTQLDDECFAPLPFLQTEQPKEDDIARCMCMTDSFLACFPVWKRIQGHCGESRPFWGLFCVFTRSTRWRLPQLSKTCVRDLVVVIRFLLIFAW